jgi:hypothetical protein
MTDRDRILRRLVFLIGGAETTFVAIAIGVVIASGQLTSGEQLSRELGRAALMIYGLPYLACGAPALLLAFMNRGLPLALGLCAFLPVLAYVAYAYA